jgi:hypothetical protein
MRGLEREPELGRPNRDVLSSLAISFPLRDVLLPLIYPGTYLLFSASLAGRRDAAALATVAATSRAASPG